MSRSPQDVYATYLLSSRGYPLWIPEPSHHLLLSRPDGLRIGDVGVVVPEDGGFEVFFNICLPREHPCHRATGVPENFKLVELRDEDIRIIPRAELPGRIISTSSVTKIRTVAPPNDASGASSGGVGYEFDLSSSGGAVLILPEGAQRYDLRNHRIFFEEATRHGTDWYRFAEERLGRMISHDSLYLITGFYKTHSWSLAAYENAAGNGDFSAQFKMGQSGGNNIAGTYTWETTRSLDWRAGPAENNGFANQSVFIRGFKVALRTGLLGKKRIEVTAGAPSTGSKHRKFFRIGRRDSWISNAWKGLSKDRASNSSSEYMSRGGSRDTGPHVVLQPMPGLPEMFHPCDIINQHLLKQEASANVAITHDDDWISMLEKGHLKPEDFVRANSAQLETVVANNFHIVSQGGVVFLQGKSDAAANPGHNEPVSEERCVQDAPLTGSNCILASDLSTMTADPPASPSSEMRESRNMRERVFFPSAEVAAPPPAYEVGSWKPPKSEDSSEKLHLRSQFKSLDVLGFRRPSDLHWLLLPYDPRTSKHLLRFDVMFPVDQICYQYSNNVREKLSDADLDAPACDGAPTTKMRLTFAQPPFDWTIDVDNARGIRCRDVFSAIFDSFDQQLTLGELWRVPNRAACDEAFRIRTLVRAGGAPVDRALGWKRVDALLHHTLFHGLTVSPEGEWVLNLGAPLPVSDLPQPPRPRASRTLSCTGDESDESSDASVRLSPPPPTLASRGGAQVAEAGSAETLAPQASVPVLPPRQRFLSRPTRRPLGPRPRPRPSRR